MNRLIAAAHSSEELRPLAALTNRLERPALYKAAQRGSLPALRRGGQLLTTQAWIAAYRREHPLATALAGSAETQTKSFAMATILETRALSKSFSGYRAIDGVSLAIEDGAIHAIIGPNGAGKTTFFNLLSGFVTPSSGSITLRGRDITGLQPHAVARLGIVRSFQINSIFTHLSVLDNVKVSLEAKTELPARFWLSGRATQCLDARALELLADVGLAAEKDLLATQLSYGRKRALELAISLAQDPQILLLDEPTAGMGTEDVGRIARLIGRVKAGRTIVLVEHNLSVVADLSDRITVLQRGKVLVEGSYAEVRADQRVIDAYLGGSGVHA